MPSPNFSSPLFSDKRCTFHNVPNIAEVEITVDLIQEIGTEVHWDRAEGVMEVTTKEAQILLHPAALFRI